VTDITEFKVSDEKLYLSPVLDLYNGEILAYEMARRPGFEMVGKMLSRALLRLGERDQPIMHLTKAGTTRCPRIAACWRKAR
jgi:putative transposase